MKFKFRKSYEFPPIFNIGNAPPFDTVSHPFLSYFSHLAFFLNQFCRSDSAGRTDSAECCDCTLLCKIEMTGTTVLTQFIITSWSFDFANSTDNSAGLRVTIVLQRRIVNEVLTSFLPTFLILVIVYATNHFNNFIFEAIVSVNLNSLLVLTTLFISVSGSLPKTAYIKMIDVWLIFAQMIAFVEVLLHTYMDALKVESHGGEREINHDGRTFNVGSENPGNISGEISVFVRYLLYFIYQSSPVMEDLENNSPRSSQHYLPRKEFLFLLLFSAFSTGAMDPAITFTQSHDCLFDQLNFYRKKLL